MIIFYENILFTIILHSALTAIKYEVVILC